MPGMTFNAERALRWLIDQPGQQASTVPDDVVPPSLAEPVYSELQLADLVHATLTLDGQFDFILTTRGRVEANRMRESYRSSLAQRRVLEWLAAHPETSPEALMKSEGAADFTGPLSEREVSLAVEELESGGYLEGTKAWGGSMIRARLTAAGQRLLRNQMSLDQVQLSGGMTTMNVSADNYGTQHIGNQAIGGQGHSMTAHIGSEVSVEDILAALSQFRNHVEDADLPADEKQDLLEEIGAIESRGPRRGPEWVRAQLNALSSAVAGTLGSESAGLLVRMISES